MFFLTLGKICVKNGNLVKTVIRRGTCGLSECRQNPWDYFHKERYFTGPEDSLGYLILTINRHSFDLQLESYILNFSNEATKNTFSVAFKIALSKEH